MKTKILGILVCTLLVATVLPVAGTINENSIFEEPQNFIDATKNGQTGSNEDWWPMYRHDPGNTGCSTSIAPNTNQLHWKQNIGEEIYNNALKEGYIEEPPDLNTSIKKSEMLAQIISFGKRKFERYKQTVKQLENNGN